MQQTSLQPKKIRFRKERNFSEKLNASFAFMSENIKPLGRNLLLIAGPFALLTGICYSVYQTYTFGAAMNSAIAGWESSPNPGLLALGVAGMIFFSLIASTLVVAITMYHIRFYLSEGHSHISTAFLWKNIWKDFFNVLGTSVFMFFCMVLLIFVLFLPLGLLSIGGPNPVVIVLMVIFVMIAFCLIAPAFLLLYPIRSIERISVFSAIDRMFRLVSGKWLSTAGLVIVMTIIQSTIAIVFAIPMYIFMIMQMMHLANEDMGALAAQSSSLGNIGMALSSGFSMLGSFAMYGLVIIALSFQYFNLAERKEATGLLERIDSFGEKKADTEDDEEQY